MALRMQKQYPTTHPVPPWLWSQGGPNCCGPSGHCSLLDTYNWLQPSWRRSIQGFMPRGLAQSKENIVLFAYQQQQQRLEPSDHSGVLSAYVLQEQSASS